jgi:transcriptional regulator with XRE-family HTH domain
MDHRNEVREFLVTRRNRITPDQAGLPAYGSNRRVPGLRREEVALLAGVSVDYYTRLERGDLSGASDGVLDALARGLQLDDAETAHLFDLARTANASPTARKPRKRAEAGIRPSIQRLLDAITDAPALVRNNYFDYVATNALGRALYAPVFSEPAANSAKYAFLNPDAEEFFPDWERNTQELVATLRGEAGRNPYDKRLSDLVGELSTRSERFRTLWAAHNVRFHRTGVKRLRHPIVGDLELTYEAFELPADPGLTLQTYTAEPGTPSADALRMLASWAATATVPGPSSGVSSQ